MTLMIDLTPDEEATLRRHASEKGQNPDALAREAVLEMLRQSQSVAADDLPAPGESLAEALKGRIGGFHSGGQYQFSENTGDAFLEILLEKKRNGKI